MSGRRYRSLNRHRIRVRSTVSGKPLVCCWDDCERLGDLAHRFVDTEGLKQVTYIFCTERHKLFHANSVRGYGSLPPGYGSLLT